MRKFAEGTKVTINQSRFEIEKLLSRFGATSFASGWDEKFAAMTFTVKNRRLRFVLVLPGVEEFEMAGSRRRSEDCIQPARDAEIRRRWRALALVLKAKFEAVESGVSKFDDEFLAHFVTQDGATIGELLGARLDAITSGRSPLLLKAG